MNENITITDVAKVASVSKATVSAALNDKAIVASQKCEKVLEIIKRLNYRPNVVMRSLSIRKTKCIRLVFKETDNHYFIKIMKGVFNSRCENGCTLLLGSPEFSPVQEIQS